MAEALSLYRSILRLARPLPYNFRQYTKRRARDSFIEHRNLSDSRQIQEVFQAGLEELGILRRQGSIHQMYHTDPLVVERANKKDKITNWLGRGRSAGIKVMKKK